MCVLFLFVFVFLVLVLVLSQSVGRPGDGLIDGCETTTTTTAAAAAAAAAAALPMLAGPCMYDGHFPNQPGETKHALPLATSQPAETKHAFSPYRWPSGSARWRRSAPRPWGGGPPRCRRSGPRASAARGQLFRRRTARARGGKRPARGGRPTRSPPSRYRSSWVWWWF